MKKLNKRERLTAAAVMLLILIAMACRQIRVESHVIRTVTGYLRAGIYIGLAAAWAFSVRRRILSAEVRRCLLLSAALMILWLCMRTLRFNVPASCVALRRYCWYGYYIPMLLIPFLGAYAAVCIGRTEEYSPPRQLKLMCIPALLVILAVFTNDLHQLAFRFTSAVTDGSGDYAYGPVYFAAVLLIAAQTAAFIALLWKKSRLPGRGRRLLLPLLPPLVGFLYTAAYVMRVPLVGVVAGDMTVVFCLIMVATYEACIAKRLIPSNTHYDELFRVSTISARITDESYRVVYASDARMDAGADVMRLTAAAPVMLPGNIRLSGAPITGGHVVWQEDMTELVDVLEELGEARENLEDSNTLLREENVLKARKAHIAEQERLYDVIQRDTRRQIELLSELTDEFGRTGDEQTRKRLLGKMTVVGAYIKRRSNLILSRTASLCARDVELTFGESLANLELLGVDCGLRVSPDAVFPANNVMRMYDLFELVAERFDMSVLTVAIAGGGTVDGVTLNADCAGDMSALASEDVTVLMDEDGAWQLSMRLRRPEGDGWAR